MNNEQEKVLLLATKASEILLRSGAEVYRADEAVNRICAACDVTYVETFTTPTGIILSLGHSGGAEGDVDAAAAAAGGETCSDGGFGETALPEAPAGGEPCPSGGLGEAALPEGTGVGALPCSGGDFGETALPGAAAGSMRSSLGTIVRKVANRSIDLEKISRVSRFIEDFSGGGMSADEGLARLEAIEAVRPYGLFVRVVAVAAAAMFFSLMNGGDSVGGVCAIGVGVVSYMASLGIERFKINRFISIFVSCVIAAGLSLLCFNLGLGSSLSAMIIGAIVVFLPGVAITNAARDLLAGDMLSGLARVTEAMLVAIALAGGVGLLLQVAPAPVRPEDATDFPLALQFCFAFMGTLGISLVVNIPKRHLFLVSAIAGCGWLAFLLVMGTGGIEIGPSAKPLACFVGACATALLAEICTRATREVATVFIIPAIFPFVPGIGMYTTILNVLEDDLQTAMHTGLETVFMAGSIAFALLVVISVTRIVRMAYSWLRGAPWKR